MNSPHPLVITLPGPTASGKTALALDIAERLDLPVINVDSRQLYREMDIGTAKPTAEQQARVPHHLLDLRRPDQPITLQEFQVIATPPPFFVFKKNVLAWVRPLMSTFSEAQHDPA